MTSMDNDQLFFAHWFDYLSHVQNRLYYRDQNLLTIQTLARLAQEHQPTVIVELGTLSGTSLRVWQRHAPQAAIRSIDLNFSALSSSLETFPFDTTNSTFLQQDILTTHFASLWADTDRVLFFVDAHDAESVPIMEHVLRTALPHLPENSLVVVDDVWYSKDRLTPDNFAAFFTQHVLCDIDELQHFDLNFAPCHMGGSCVGFRETLPLLDYINARRIALHHEEGGKTVWFPWSARQHYCTPIVPCTFAAATIGQIHYSPFSFESSFTEENDILQKAAALYAEGRVYEIDSLLHECIVREASPVIYAARATVLAAMGQFEFAREHAAVAVQYLNIPQLHNLHKALDTRLNTQRPCPDPVQGLAIFTTPKPFRGLNGITQRNAICSWRQLSPDVQIILMGNEEGTAEMAAEVGALHIPDCRCNEFGTPLVNAMFEQAAQACNSNILAYVNADIILLDSFLQGITAVATELDEFLLIGRRWDVDVTEEIDFTPSNWQEQLLNHTRENGFLHAACGIDYFVHTRGLWLDIPPFAVGRTYWDGWLVSHPLARGKAVVDGSDFITIVHQEHAYAHLAGGRKSAWQGVEARRNAALFYASGLPVGMTSRANIKLSNSGQLIPAPEASADDSNKTLHMEWLQRQAERMEKEGHLELALAHYETLLAGDYCSDSDTEALKVKFAELQQQNNAKQRIARTPIPAIFLEECTVTIDPLSTLIGGSWQSKDSQGLPIPWDPDVLAFFLARTREISMPYVLDIGANTGTFSLLPVLNANIHGMAFEPNPRAYELLNINLELNNMTTHIETMPIALSNSTGTLTLKLPSSGTDSGLANLGTPMRFDSWYELPVPVDTLDNIMYKKQPERIDLIKIDTEGCELLVLQGAERCLRTFRPHILTEYEARNTAQFGYHPEDITTFLGKLGYSFERVGKDDLFYSHPCGPRTGQITGKV